ncbi:MAG: hypothetical protein K6F86_06945 [Lachnospiraceae bacterium]|nr:hypothetical protein [Lachnospiraceae bacterium]
MEKLDKNKIEEIYDLINKYHSNYLKPLGVKLPNLKNNKGLYTKDALALIYLAQGYPNTGIVSKSELTNFIKLYYPDTNDVQQARHLAAQKGWFILSGTRNDNSSAGIPAGSYKLISLEKAYDGFNAERRVEDFTGDFWEDLKKRYDYRCACCGSEEGKPHRYWKNIIVTLQKGHKNPAKPLTEDNTIPQCESCNRPDRNYWIYDDKGRVIRIANEKVIDSCDADIQKKIYKRLYEKYKGKNPDFI